MQALDPVDDQQNPVAPSDNQSADASKPGMLRSAWDAWTSNPANNAALLQFGVAMLQPRGPGQTALGQAANSVAEGGEAAGRATAAQTAENQRALAEEEARSKMDLQAAQGRATEANASAYGRQVDALGGGGKTGASAVLAQQRAFNSWLGKPEDGTGLSIDPILAAIQKVHPEVKSKADLIGNPKYRSEAFQLFRSSMPEADATEEGGGAPAPAPTAAVPAPAPATPSPRVIYDKAGKPYSWDGVKGHAPVPM